MGLSRRNLQSVLIAWAALTLAACDQPRPMKSADFIGAYRSTKNCGSEVLHLFSDGRYRMEFAAPLGGKKQNSGLWIYDAAQQRMEFSDFQFGYRMSRECYSFPPVERRGTWQPYVDTTWRGKIYFEFDVDLYDGYVKDE